MCRDKEVQDIEVKIKEDMETRIYKLNLFETLRSLISCSIETHTDYKFIDLDYGFTKGCVPFNQLNQIMKSKEWMNILDKLSHKKEIP